jgi:hypothetical protein
MPALGPSLSPRRGKFFLDPFFDETPDPIHDPRFDRVGLSLAEKQRAVVDRRRPLRRHGVISAGATTPAPRSNEPEIALPAYSNHFAKDTH